MKPSAIGADDLMHATLVRRPFSRAGWAFENKLDGFRALARRENDVVELLSRTGRQIGPNFPEVVSALKRIPGTSVLDGELVVTDSRGHPSFEGLRRRGVMTRSASMAAAARESPGALCVFNVLLALGSDLRPLPLLRRKDLLGTLFAQRLVDDAGDLGVQIVPWLEAHGEALFAQARELDLEGMVGKDLSAPYWRGMQPTWVKIKNPSYSRQEALGFRR